MNGLKNSVNCYAQWNSVGGSAWPVARRWKANTRLSRKLLAFMKCSSQSPVTRVGGQKPTGQNHRRQFDKLVKKSMSEQTVTALTSGVQSTDFSRAFI